MFTCEICGESSLPRQKCRRITTKTREKTYPARDGVNRVANWLESKEDKINSSNDNGGKGTEIVEEIKVCRSCFTKHQEQQALEL